MHRVMYTAGSNLHIFFSLRFENVKVKERIILLKISSIGASRGVDVVSLCANTPVAPLMVECFKVFCHSRREECRA